MMRVDIPIRDSQMPASAAEYAVDLAEGSMHSHLMVSDCNPAMGSCVSGDLRGLIWPVVVAS